MILTVFATRPRPLQPGVFLLKVLQPLCLIDPQPTEFLLSSVIRLLRHADLLDRLQDKTASVRALPV
jgi:hypothetical protein